MRDEGKQDLGYIRRRAGALFIPYKTCEIHEADGAMVLPFRVRRLRGLISDC